MSIRSKQRLKKRIVPIVLGILLITAGWYIGSETYKVAQSINNIEQNFSILDSFVDEWMIDELYAP